MSDAEEHERACAWFAAYLDGLALDYRRDPDDLGIDKVPDFLLERPDGAMVCELKTFRPSPGVWVPAEGEAYVARDLAESIKPIRNHIRAAASQLKPLAGRGMPLIVVLSDPQRAGVPLGQTVYAMFGDLRVEMYTDTDGEVRSEWQADRNGKLRNDHPYISAVLVLQRGSEAVDELNNWNPDEIVSQEEFDRELAARLERARQDPRPYWKATLIESIGSEAAPVPEGIFIGAHDMRWRLNAERTAIIQGHARIP